MITDEIMYEAIDRIARTADGELFYRWLQKRLTAVVHTPNDSALRQDAGERMLAQTLMGLMAKGMRETNGHRTDAAVIFTSPEQRASQHHPSGRRRGGPYEREFGDDGQPRHFLTGDSAA